MILQLLQNISTSNRIQVQDQRILALNFELVSVRENDVEALEGYLNSLVVIDTE